MHPASLDDYRRAPLGRFVAFAASAHFVFDTAPEPVAGTVFVGRPDAADIRALTEAIAIELPGGLPMHRALADASRVTGIDPEAFAVLSGAVGPLADAFGSNVSRQAIVVPEGAAGLVVAGFYDVTPSATPERTRLFASVDEAVAWLDVADPEGLLRAASSVADALLPSSPEVRAVMAAVDRGALRVTVGEVAASLGMTTRALQERLSRQGTSFRAEVQRARRRRAEALLVETDTKLAAIAAAVGCASVQHFVTWFGRATGESPAAYRAARRR